MDHDEYWAQRAAALFDEEDNVPRMEPPPPPPQAPLRISGASVQAVFYGVGSNDAFLNTLALAPSAVQPAGQSISSLASTPFPPTPAVASPRWARR